MAPYHPLPVTDSEFNSTFFVRSRPRPPSSAAPPWPRPCTLFDVSPKGPELIHILANRPVFYFLRPLRSFASLSPVFAFKARRHVVSLKAIPSKRNRFRRITLDPSFFSSPFLLKFNWPLPVDRTKNKGVTFGSYILLVITQIWSMDSGG